LTRLKLQLIAYGLGIFLVSLGVGYLLISGCLKPLKPIERTAVNIGQGKLSERIPAKYHGKAREFDILITELNRTFAQLESLFQRQIRFTAEASHELKTPLTILISQIELALKRPRSDEEYRESFKLCAQSAER